MTFYDLLHHQVTACPYLAPSRGKLINRLRLYGYQAEPDHPRLEDLEGLFARALLDRNLLAALTDFLDEVDFK